MAYLAMRPRDIGPYLRHSLLSRRSPLDLGMPWWSFGAVQAVAARLTPQMRVFEYGSGGSTLFLANKALSVTCVEDSPEWHRLVGEAAASRCPGRVQVLHRAIDLSSVAGFVASDYFKALAEPYDVIVVDGMEGDVTVRDECFWRAQTYVRPGGLIILDDSHRYPQVLARNAAKAMRVYKGAGYCRRGVTSTTLFEY